MSQNAIKSIVEAEDAAKAAKADALARVKLLIEQAEALGRETVAASALRADEKNRNLSAETVAQAEEYSRELTARTDAQRGAIRSRAEERFGPAAKIIVERITGG